MQIAKSKNIYLLSEQGYAKLVKIMDTDLAKDVVNWIDYDVNKVGQLLRNVDEDEKAVSPIYYSGQVRNMWFLTEDGLYEVLNNAKQRIVKFKIIMVVKVGNKLYCLLVYDNFR